MAKKNNEIFSKNLKFYMAVQNKTRNDIVRDLGIPYTSIRDYENGICGAKRDKVEKLAEYLKIKPYQLTEPHDMTEIMNIMDNSEDSKELLEIVKKLSRANLERKKQVNKIIDMLDKDEQ